MQNNELYSVAISVKIEVTNVPNVWKRWCRLMCCCSHIFCHPFDIIDCGVQEIK